MSDVGGDFGDNFVGIVVVVPGDFLFQKIFIIFFFDTGGLDRPNHVPVVCSDEV